jgi:thiamine pyrophosphokinase
VTCVICLNGEYEDEDYYLRQVDAAQAVVAADGGHGFLRRHGRWPALLIGDFDSLDARLVTEARAAGVEVVTHPTHKDETDAELAVAQAEARFAGAVVLLGALGGALDHVFGHLAVLRGAAARGRAARIAAPGLSATVLQGPVTARLGAPVGARVSVVALSPDVVLTLRGFDYELSDEPLPPNVCRGLSNRVAAPGARIALASGQLLALVFDGAETFAAEPLAAGETFPAGPPAPGGDGA